MWVGQWVSTPHLWLFSSSEVGWCSLLLLEDCKKRKHWWKGDCGPFRSLYPLFESLQQENELWWASSENIQFVKAQIHLVLPTTVRKKSQFTGFSFCLFVFFFLSQHLFKDFQDKFYRVALRQIAHFRA